ncbi:FliM/FliN family flagellar motor switch protein, partial [Acinetobacter baumannii]
EAVLDEQVMSLRDVMKFEIGSTILFNATPESPVDLRCGGVPMVSGRMGRMGNRIAVRVDRALKRVPRL